MVNYTCKSDYFFIQALIKGSNHKNNQNYVSDWLKHTWGPGNWKISPADHFTLKIWYLIVLYCTKNKSKLFYLKKCVVKFTKIVYEYEPSHSVYVRKG
jgi:hypothetical protein